MNAKTKMIKLYHRAILLVFLMLVVSNSRALTSLADQPVFATSTNTPGNVALALSVEFPTALGSAYTSNYSASQEFLGYFDPKKCYQYDLAVGLYNTGVDDNNNLLVAGTTDSHWTLTSAPSGYGNGVMNVARDNLYLGNTVTAKSIGLQSSPPQYTNYTYSTSFVLPSNVSASGVVISFSLGHDDSLTSIKVNGSDTRITSGSFSFGDSIVLNSSNSTFVSGATNTITITVFNVTGEAGIRIDNMSVSAGGAVLRNTDGNYFKPLSAANSHVCNGLWSGNLLNWAITQTIDPFRSTLTGGYRSVDKINTTVLEKAWASGQGGNVVQPTITGNQTLISQSTPYSNFTNFHIYINGQRNKFLFYGDGNGSIIADTAIPAQPNNNDYYTMYGRVKVCDSTTAMGLSGLESNCVAYGNNYKPEGLIQANSTNLNFAAFGYLNDSSDNPQRDGGVLRAKMAALGPSSTNPEWSGTTGIFYTNPDATDASNSGVSNSGVINYLNKFGLTSGTYKTFDPVSELYYSVIRYFKNQGNISAYTSGLTDFYKDGFPVITNWNDPIQSSCQQNFIIGIGDTNTWADADLPGSTIYSYSGKEPTSRPPEISNDKTVDVRLATNAVGQLEGLNNKGLGNLGEIYTPWCCTGNTFFVAGLAYDSHTKDIRSDLNGSQTITTYWLDVLESGDRKDYAVTGMRNQFWLTAKYGGFTGTNPSSSSSLVNNQWDTNNDGDPDNYFRADKPSLMKSSLTQAFSSIASLIQGSSNSFAVTSPAVQSGSISYATYYNSFGWTGDVVASQLSISTGGIISSSTLWNASPKLETQASGVGWDGSRMIATVSTQASGCATTSNTAGSVSATMLQNSCGVPFRLGNLSASQKTALTSTSANQQSVLNFLRGDRSNAGNLGSKLYRDRVMLLGDIVNSKVVPVGPPSMPYIDSFNPGYSSFKTTYKNRSTVVYVGANDGMLHAFNGSATGGNELFAYVPNALFLGPNNTPATDGLAQLASISYVHHYYVDATPMVKDVNFGGNTNDWHTLLVSGLGKGGKSYFAIDVTNPATLNNETNLAAAVQWEFSHPLMGYTYDTPLIVKTVKYGWVVVLTSGYNNADGQGYIFIINPKTGALLENPIATGAGSIANDAGLAHVNGFVADARSGVADALYAGDLLGNLWRVDLTGTTGSYSALKIAILSTDISGTNRQPVTTSPVAEVDVSTGKRYVFVGTGKFLDSTDLNNTQTQTFYAINDGTLSSFYTSTTLPGGISFPITRNNMVDDTSTLLAGATTTAAKPMGYFIDLGTNPSNGKTNFVNAELASAAGIISFIANSVDNSDVCKPTGRNLTYAVSYGTGQSALTDSSGNPISNISGSGLGTSLNFVQSTFLDSTGATQTGIKLVKCDDQGNCVVLNPKSSSTKPFTQLNWREVPTPE